MTSTKDGNNNTTSYQYDGVLAAYRTAVTNALGQATHTAYSDYWNIASITDPNDAVTAFTHDDFGRPTSITRPLDQTYANNVEYSYSLGSPRSLVRVDVLRVAVGTLGPIRRDTYYQTAWWFYDGLGRVIQQQAQGADGSIILANTAYDPMGRVQRVSDPYDPAVASGQTAYLYHALVPELYGGAGGAAPTPTPTPSFQGGTYVPADWRRPATAYQYDALGRPVATLYADGTSSTTAYNQLTTTFTDANGHRKDTVSDKFGRTVAVNEYHDSATLSTTYGYDVMDNLRFVVDSGGAGMGYEYDQLGRKTASSDADMGDWTYDYDHAGNVIQQTDAMGQRTCLYYDPLNRLVGKKYQSSGTNCPGDPGAYDVTNTYDQGDNGIGHRTSMNDRSGSTAWQYDAEGRLTAQTESINGAPEAYTTTWTYDEMDRPLSMTYPDGESVPMTYNSQGLVATLGGYVTGSSYNPAGQPLELDFGDGTQTNYAYNPLNRRLTQLQTAGGASAIQNLSYDYDNVGNITQITDAVRNEVTTFGYDDLDRLTSASIAGVYSHAWQYDSTGNIIQRTEDSTPVTYTYGDNEHQPHAVTAVGARTFDYDANGDMIRRAGDELTYDEENRLTRVVAAGVTSVFTYDGDGNRVKKEVGSGGTTTTFYVGNYYEVTGTTATKYYYFGTLRVAMKQGDAVTYLHGDNLGSTSVTSGATVSAQTYYAFGAIRTTTGVVPTDFGFTGQRFDSDAGLMYYNARYYDATIGRFVQPDTIIPDLYDPQSLNRYSYVRNNPVRNTDPTGHGVDLGDPYYNAEMRSKRASETVDWDALPSGDDGGNERGGSIVDHVHVSDLNGLAGMVGGKESYDALGLQQAGDTRMCKQSLAECFREGKYKVLTDGQTFSDDEWEELLKAIAADVTNNPKPKWEGLWTVSMVQNALAGRWGYDTPLANTSNQGIDRTVCVARTCGKQSDINYVGQGIWGASAGETIDQTKDVILTWNTRGVLKSSYYVYNNNPVQRYFWAEYGYGWYTSHSGK
ncbi:MAG: hypothetical protein M1482_04065 [Chloroflexi bacterium]|nr:hypothetical protein [Chloroflexota bacterium]